MKRLLVILAVVVGLVVAYVGAHLVLIELDREVVVLRTEEPDGNWLETRLWIIDDGDASWLHGGDSRWIQNLKARPIVEVERGDATRRYRAETVAGSHRRLHALLREKYGLADRWVRFVGPDRDSTLAVRLTPVEGD